MKEVKKLIDLGKEKGYLTYDDVNDMLPAEVVSPDQIDDVMSIFGEMDIEVVDSNQRVTLGGAGEDLADDEEDEKEIEGETDGDAPLDRGDARKVARGREHSQAATGGGGFVRVVGPERLMPDPQRAERHLEPPGSGRRR